MAITEKKRETEWPHSIETMCFSRHNIGFVKWILVIKTFQISKLFMWKSRSPVSVCLSKSTCIYVIGVNNSLLCCAHDFTLVK